MDIDNEKRPKDGVYGIGCDEREYITGYMKLEG